jgi:hypothetical protein
MRVMEGLLFGVRAGDPVVLAASASVLMGAAILASCGPARPALRIDPVRMLRR